MKDLVIQGPALSAEALDTFKVVCMPERINVAGPPRAASQCTTTSKPARRYAASAITGKLDTAFVDPDVALAATSACSRSTWTRR